MNIDELSLTIRVVGHLRNAGICTVEDLIKLTREQLVKVNGIGPVTVRDIAGALEAKGLTLGMSTTAPETMPIPGKTYCHFKGGRYTIITLARSAETEEWMVVYVALNGSGLWVRPVREWVEPTDRWPDGRVRARFIEDTT